MFTYQDCIGGLREEPSGTDQQIIDALEKIVDLAGGLSENQKEHLGECKARLHDRELQVRDRHAVCVQSPPELPCYFSIEAMCLCTLPRTKSVFHT